MDVPTGPDATTVSGLFATARLKPFAFTPRGWIDDATPAPERDERECPACGRDGCENPPACERHAIPGMPLASPSDGFVPLKQGPAVPVSVVLWLTHAEDRGLRLRLEPDGRVHVGPRALVEPGDLAFIQEHRSAVVATLAYIDEAQPC